MPAFRTAIRIGSLAACVLIGLTSAARSAPDQGAPPQANPPNVVVKLHPALLQRLDTEPGPAKTWVFFADKGIHSPEDLQAALRHVAETYNPRAVQRRALRGQNAARGGALFDEHDLPVVPTYVEAVTATGAKVHITSRWLNAISVWATREQAEQIASLPFVDRLEAVARARHVQPMNVQDIGPGPFGTDGDERTINYGVAAEQLTQINLVALHDAGYTGSGVVIGILDSGFHRTHEAFNNPTHPLNVLAEYDFVMNDGNTDIQTGDPSGQADHGTMILGCIGAYKPGSMVGGAYDASFVLTKTEDTSQEIPAEEDNYVAGLEFQEAHGADMTTSSLGYIDWYTQAQLNGQTAVTTVACNISTANGVHHTNAAGNEYHDSNPAIAHLIAPADGFQVITCGAADSTGAIAYFSSDGPTADGRVKPEVLARGVSTHTVSPSSNTSYTTADGTSLSTPLVACAVACLIQARPYWTVDQMRQHLFETADYYVANGTYDPLYIRGYGMVNAFGAFNTCPEAGVVTLDRPKYKCQSTANVVVNDCGLNTNDNVVESVPVVIVSTSEPAGEILHLTETAPDSAEFAGSITLSTTNAPGVLLVAAGNAITVTYNDADNGQGSPAVVTATAVVDCTPPTISNVHATNIQARTATIAFNTNEPARGTVHYGLSCGALGLTAGGSGFATTPTVDLSGLQDNTVYYYTVEAQDEAGNSTADPTCYTFTTPEIPDYFTQLFTTDNDLDNISLSFTPNNSSDFYHACNEAISALPTDPAGGTTLSLTDDSYATVSVGSGQTVKLYGVSYTQLYVGSNGYITFGSGDSSYTEALDAHFNQPRVSALFDDLDPSQGGTLSWKQLADRLVVTWLNVPEHNGSNQNTFQIELFFDGQIKINYLAVAATDGLAGLSAGGGVSPDFYMSDLSALGSCQNYPPVAQNGTANTPQSTAVNVTLAATDDGMPNPPGYMTYVVTSLPLHGQLADPQGSAITAAPYALLNGAKIVHYTPHLQYVGTDTFQFKANDGGTPPDGGDSNVATVTVTMTGVPQLAYSFPLNTDPGWTKSYPLWAFGVPAGLGSHAKDPTSGHTGANVYGYNLNGDYTSSMPARTLDDDGAQLQQSGWRGVAFLALAGCGAVRPRRGGGLEQRDDLDDGVGQLWDDVQRVGLDAEELQHCGDGGPSGDGVHPLDHGHDGRVEHVPGLEH